MFKNLNKPNKIIFTALACVILLGAAERPPGRGGAGRPPTVQRPPGFLRGEFKRAKEATTNIEHKLLERGILASRGGNPVPKAEKWSRKLDQRSEQLKIDFQKAAANLEPSNPPGKSGGDGKADPPAVPNPPHPPPRPGG